MRRAEVRVAAVGFPTRNGFDVLDRLDARIEATIAAMALARDVGAPCVVRQIGKIPPAAIPGSSEPETPESAAFAEALTRIGQEGDRIGVRLAVETAFDGPVDLAKFVASLDTAGISFAWNPARLLPIASGPERAVESLYEKLELLYVRDAMRSGAAIGGVREVAMGRGEIDWRTIFDLLAEADFAGPRVLCRLEPPNEPARLDDLASEMKVLRG